MKKLAVIVAAVSIVVFTAFAYGDMDGNGMGSGMMGSGMMGSGMMGSGMMGGCGMDGQMMDAGHHMSKYLMGLNLDDQQKPLIGEIKSRMMKETIRRTAEMRIIRIELKDLLSKDPVDMTAVEAKVKQLEMLRTDMCLSHIRAIEEIKTKLTPEQRKKLREMIEAGPMMEGMGMRHGQEGIGMRHDHERGMMEK